MTVSGSTPNSSAQQRDDQRANANAAGADAAGAAEATAAAAVLDIELFTSQRIACLRVTASAPRWWPLLL